MQGADPVTDFRGMGLLSLKVCSLLAVDSSCDSEFNCVSVCVQCLVFMGEKYGQQVQTLVSVQKERYAWQLGSQCCWIGATLPLCLSWV